MTKTPKNPKNISTLAPMLRVDHAGEYGAIRIYEGQLAVLRHAAGQGDVVAEIDDMAAHEEVHLDYFSDALNAHEARPTGFLPVWHIGGFALGAVSALWGPKAAMLCTAAVERVIDAHYAEQMDTLKGVPDTKALKETIARFRAEECEHGARAQELGGTADTPALRLFDNLVASVCRVAITLSK